MSESLQLQLLDGGSATIAPLADAPLIGVSYLDQGDALFGGESHAAAGEEGASGLWRHSSGVLLPRGTVVTSQLDDFELEELSARSEQRGAVAGALQARRVKRSLAEENQLHAFCEWLASYELNAFGTVSFTDDYAARYGIYSLSAALRDVRRGLADCPMKRGAIKGFRGRYVLSGEWHPSGRLVPHVHLALDCMGAPIEKVCGDLYRYFFRTRGRSRFEPMRDVDTATLYALKDTVKASAKDPTSVEFRLHRPRCHRGRR